MVRSNIQHNFAHKKQSQEVSSYLQRLMDVLSDLAPEI